MACGCSTIETPPCGLSVEVCKGWYVALDIVVDSIISGPSHGTLIEAGSAYIYQHDNLSLDSDTIIYDNGVTECTISITILDTVPEDTQLVTFTASGTCEVSTPTYLWTLPEGVTLHPNDNLYQQTIHVYVPLYDPDNPDAEYVITVDVCCGACNDCCKCETITWHPPICTEECGEDPDCYCDDPCLVYNPLTGNCEPLCPPDLLCCPIDTLLKEADIASIDSISVDCTTVTLDPINDNLVDITLTLTATTTGLDADELIWSIANPDTCGNPLVDCGVDWRECGVGGIITVSSGQTKGQISDWISISWVDGTLSVDMDGDWLDAYQNNIENGAPNVPFNIFVTVSAADHCDPIQSNYVISIDVIDFVCETNIVITSDQFMGKDLCKQTSNCPELRGDVYVCQECCDDLDCPTGNCENGICLCPDGSVPDPVTGLCPCPDPLPLCNTCTPLTTGYILTQIGEDPESCVPVFEYYDYETCTCKCQIGYCYQLIIGPGGTVTQTECQICPVCANPAEMWYQVTAEGSILYGISCPSLCETCVNNVCVPVVCEAGTIPNPIPGRTPCCIPDPCNEFDCDDPNAINYCPEIPGCGCESGTTDCVSCSTIDCDEQEDCPFGCNCDTDTGKCVHNPCDTYTCEDENDPEYCPQIPDCGCDDVLGCIPCDTVPCPNGDECPEGCACDENTETCVHNPCFTAQCSDEDDLQTYCPVVDGCGCEDQACLPCSTVECTEDDDCPFGCRCADNEVCETNPCVVLDLTCGLNVVTATYQFNLNMTVNGSILEVTVDTTATEWLTDTIISGPLSDILEWEINLSPFVDGYINIDDLDTYLGVNAFVETPTGLNIDTSLFDYEFIMVRCTVLNTDVGGTPISVTYRYQDIDTEITDQWKEGLGSICYAMYTVQYDPEIPFDNVNTWYIDTDNDEDIDLTITPADPEFGLPTVVGSVPGFGVAFAGNEYLIITCPDPSNYTVTADVNAGECLNVTACGTGEPCPCTGSSSCEGVTITELNSLEGTTWIVGLDLFDTNGDQFPWKCEPLSPVQGCGGIPNDYNTECGGLIPVEYASAILIPAQLCCLSDSTDLGTPWEDADPNGNDDWGGPNAQCNNCCCGWAYSGVTITSINGSNVVAEITNYAEAKICFQILLDGGTYGIEDACCKYYCVTPPEPTCEDMSVSQFEIGCNEDNTGFEFSFDITNPNSSGPYSIEIANNAVCSNALCNPFDPGTCDFVDGCYCQPDSDTTYRCKPLQYSIPLPPTYCTVPGIPAWACEPYENNDVIEIAPPFPLFPLTPESTQTFTITDLTTGCSVQYTDDIPCCLNYELITYPNLCIKDANNVIVNGYNIFINSNYVTEFTIEVTIDYLLLPWGTVTSMSNYVTFISTLPGSSTGVNGVYTGVTAASGVLFGGLSGIYPTDNCPNYGLLYADLNNYDITINVYPTNAPNCNQVITLNNYLQYDYNIVCGNEAVDITIDVLNHVLGTLYTVTVDASCGTPIVTQTENIIQITGCTSTVSDVYITIVNAGNLLNNASILIPASEIQTARLDCPCMDVESFYSCNTDEFNILVNGSNYGNNVNFVLEPLNCTCNNLISFTFTGPYGSFIFSDFDCSVPSGTVYSFILYPEDHPECNTTLYIDTDPLNCGPLCEAEPTYTYDCETGFLFTNAVGATIYFIDGAYTECPGTNCYEIEEGMPCPGAGCHEGSGILWFVYDETCYALLGITNFLHTIEQAETVFPDPPGVLPYLMCGESGPGDYITFQIVGGTAPFSVTVDTDPPGGGSLFPSTTVNTSDTTVTIAIDNPIAGDHIVTVASTAPNITCEQTIPVTYDCVVPCNNDPSLLIQCGGCGLQQVWRFGGPGEYITLTTQLGEFLANGSPLSGTIPTTSFATWQGNTYVTTTIPALGVDIIIHQPNINNLEWEIYVVAPCCTEWDTLELEFGSSNNFLLGTNLGLSSCQQIQTYDENHKCCFCFTAAKTGVVTSPTITDEIQYGCKHNTINAVVWAAAPMNPDNITTECINCYEINPVYSPSVLYFQRVVEYADGCAERNLAYLLHDSGDSRILCRLGTQGYFIIELENMGTLPIPAGTVFDLAWTGLGTGTVFGASTNCTINPLGTEITTTTLVDVGEFIGFNVRYNNPGCAINSNTIDITTSDITLSWTPITITKTL